MRIASQKYDENIAEYVLYMWHLEDMLRACEFDMDVIIPNIIIAESGNDKINPEVEQWYLNFIDKMIEEGIQEKGHLNELNEIMIELLYLHNSLLNVCEDKAYEKVYMDADPMIRDFRMKSNTSTLNPVEICLTGQYAKLLLRLQKKEITDETENAFEAFRKVLAYLAKKYKEMKLGAYTAMQ